MLSRSGSDILAKVFSWFCNDFLPASGSIDLNVVGSGELEDVHYKN